MAKSNSTGIIAGIGVGVLALGLLLTWILYPADTKVQEVDMGHGWTCEIGYRDKIEPLLPKQLTRDPNLTVYGYTNPILKKFYIISHNPPIVAAHWHQLGVLFEKELELPTVEASKTDQYKALDDESQDVSGTIFHEIIGHGSDATNRGHLKTTLNYFWPEIQAPTSEPIRNPWSILVRAWPETYTYEGKLLWKSIGQHDAWAYISDDKYLSTYPPFTNAKNPYTLYTIEELKKLNE